MKFTIFWQKIKVMERQKKIIWAALIIITLIGAWLRLYNFSDWLLYESDQARDVILVSEGVQGNFFDLPLLGPKASGTGLHLGPGFYYLEYISGLFFGDTPAGHSLFVALLSIFSIPLFYLLLKRFFHTTIALGLTWLYSISAYFVLTSRYLWNPNVLPFFTLAIIYSLLRATDKSSSRPGYWLVLSAFLLSLGTHFHFVAFFVLPIFFIAVLLIKRPCFSWKAWTAAVIIALSTYSAVFVNEYLSGGGNTKAFLGAVSGRGNSKNNWAEKIVQNTLTQSKAYALLLSGNDHIFLPHFKIKGLAVKKVCGDHCKETSDFLSGGIVAFFLTGIGLMFYQIKKRRNDWLAIGLLFLSISFIFTLLASELAPRFFLLLAPLPFIFLGLIINSLWRIPKKIGPVIFILVLLFLSAANLKVIKARFSELSLAAEKKIKTPADHILDEPIRSTLAQQEKIAEYFQEAHQKNGYPVFVDFDPYWERSIWYLVEKKNIPVIKLRSETSYLQGNNFIVMRSDKKVDSKLKKYASSAELAEKKEFGTLTVYALRPKPEAAISENPPVIPLVDLMRGDKSDIRQAAVSGVIGITWRDAMNDIFLPEE